MLPDPDQGNSISGAEPSAPEPQPTLREIAEAAWDEGSDPADDGALASDGSPRRDERGRFAPKEPVQEAGEAKAKEPSSPENKTPEAQARPDPAAPPRDSNQPPEHWSAEDRATYEKLPQEAKSFFMRRYNEMEADYTRKSQANAEAVQTVSAIAPIFNDPDIAKSIREADIHPVQAIYDWARLHKGATSADPKTKAAVLIEIAERMGFDPALLFARNRPEPTPEQRRDPNFQIADLRGKTESELRALRAELQQFKASENERIEAEAVKVSRSAIDRFADEKGSDGKPLRPYFDKVVASMVKMFEAEPNRDMAEAYDTACWADPEIRKELIRSEWTRNQNQVSNQRAQQAARSNVRGMTSPVTKPNPEKKSNGSLRDALEASADEVGF